MKKFKITCWTDVVQIEPNVALGDYIANKMKEMSIYFTSEVGSAKLLKNYLLSIFLIQI